MRNLALILVTLFASLAGISQPNFFQHNDGQDWRISGGFNNHDSIFLFGGVSNSGNSIEVANLSAKILAFNILNNEFGQIDFNPPNSLAIIDFLDKTNSGYIGFGRTQPDSLGFSNFMLFKLDNQFNVTFNRNIDLPRAKQFISHIIHIHEWEDNFFVALSESESPSSGVPIYRNFFCKISPEGEVVQKRIILASSPQSDISSACIAQDGTPFISIVNVNGTETVFQLDSNLQLVPFFAFPLTLADNNTNGVQWSFARGSFILNDTYNIGIRRKETQLSPFTISESYSAITIPLEDTSQWNGLLFGDSTKKNIIYNYELNPNGNQSVIIGSTGKYSPYTVGPFPTTLMIDIIDGADSLVHSFEFQELGDITTKDICFSDSSIFVLGRFYSDNDTKYYSPLVIRFDNKKLIQSTKAHQYAKGKFKVFPNPISSGESLTIIDSFLNPESKIHFVDLQGRMFPCENWSSSQIKIPTLAEGNYTLIITNGKNSLRKKILIH